MLIQTPLNIELEIYTPNQEYLALTAYLYCLFRALPLTFLSASMSCSSLLSLFSWCFYISAQVFLLRHASMSLPKFVSYLLCASMYCPTLVPVFFLIASMYCPRFVPFFSKSFHVMSQPSSCIYFVLTCLITSFPLCS